jgi:hypothetical protein
MDNKASQKDSIEEEAIVPESLKQLINYDDLFVK